MFVKIGKTYEVEIAEDIMRMHALVEVLGRNPYFSGGWRCKIVRHLCGENTLDVGKEATFFPDELKPHN